MKKFYVVLVAVLWVSSISVQAQLKFGVKGGLNLSKLSSTDPNAIQDSQTGWHAGLMAEFKKEKFGVEVDALYSQTGSKVDFSGTVEDLKNTYISIPVVAKLYLLKVLNIQAGPQFSFLTSSELGETDFKDQLASNDLQIVFGIGVDISLLHASVRYSLGLKDINASTTQTFDLKNNAVMLSVGIWLKK